MERFVRNFAPELRVGKKSLQYILWRRAVESSAEFIETHMPGAQSFEAREGLYRYALQIAPPAGLLMECGVRNGTSINIIAKMTDRTIHGFDSFEGLPDDGIIPNFRDTGSKWYAGKMDMGGKFPAVPSNVVLHKGWFSQTLPAFFEQNDEPIAFLHVDCDIYSSTMDVLKCSRRNIRIGTVILFDEYVNYLGWQHNEHRALMEFANESGVTYDFIGYNFSGGAAIVVRKIRSSAM